MFMNYLDNAYADTDAMCSATFIRAPRPVLSTCARELYRARFSSRRVQLGKHANVKNVPSASRHVCLLSRRRASRGTSFRDFTPRLRAPGDDHRVSLRIRRDSQNAQRRDLGAFGWYRRRVAIYTGRVCTARAHGASTIEYSNIR